MPLCWCLAGALTTGLVGTVLAMPGVGPAPVRPAPPSTPPSPSVPAWGDQLNWRPDWADVPLGVGHFGPAAPDGNGAAWVARALVPLYDAPGGNLMGWLARGQLLRSGSASTPLTTRAMVETSYETASFVVLERRDDRWFRFGYGPGLDEGSAWSHKTLLDLGDDPLVVETWPAVFRRVGALHFRKEVPHTLRAAPDATAEEVAKIGLNHQLEPLEVQGEWLRVRVYQPAKICRSPESWQGTSHQGWVRWSSPEKGPWVWYYTRGC